MKQKTQSQQSIMNVNDLADIEVKIRDARTSNQQKEKYLQQYEKKIMNQQTRYKQLQTAFQKVSFTKWTARAKTKQHCSIFTFVCV